MKTISNLSEELKINQHSNLALDSFKLSINGAEKYAENMTNNADTKKDFFIREIDGILSRKNTPIRVCDIWCCSGSLISVIKQHFKEKIIAIWIDISPNMIKMAKKSYKWISFHVGNAYFTPKLADASVDVILWSSLLHELGSYYDKSFTHESYNLGIKTWLCEANRLLSKWGTLLIKDPVKPLNWDKWVILKNKHSNIAPKIDISDINSLRWQFISPSELPIQTRIEVFVKNFPWNKDSNTVVSNGNIHTTRAMTSEIARHIPLPISDTWEHFIDEQDEWYGSWNENDWNIYERTSWKMQVQEHKISFSHSNHAAKIKDDFELFDIYGNSLLFENILPTHQFTILNKN